MNRRDVLKSLMALVCAPLVKALPAAKPIIGVDLAKGESSTRFHLEGLPLPVVHRDFALKPLSLVDVARARGLDEKTIKEIEVWEAGLKRDLAIRGIVT